MKTNDDMLNQILNSDLKPDQALGLYALFLIQNPATPFPTETLAEVQKTLPLFTASIPEQYHGRFISFYLHLVLVKFYKGIGNSEDVDQLNVDILMYFHHIENNVDVTENILTTLKQSISLILDIMYLLHTKNDDKSKHSLEKFQFLYTNLNERFQSLSKECRYPNNEAAKYCIMPIYAFILKMIAEPMDKPENVLPRLLDSIPDNILSKNLNILARLFKIIPASKKQFIDALVTYLKTRGIKFDNSIEKLKAMDIGFEIVKNEYEASIGDKKPWKKHAHLYMKKFFEKCESWNFTLIDTTQSMAAYLHLKGMSLENINSILKKTNNLKPSIIVNQDLTKNLIKDLYKNYAIELKSLIIPQHINRKPGNNILSTIYIFSSKYSWLTDSKCIILSKIEAQDNLFKIVIKHMELEAFPLIKSNAFEDLRLSDKKIDFINHLYKLPPNKRLTSWNPFELLIFIKEIEFALRLYISRPKIDIEKTKIYISRAEIITIDYIKNSLISPPLESLLEIQHNHFFEQFNSQFGTKRELDEYLAVIENAPVLYVIINKFKERWDDFLKCQDLDIIYTIKYLYLYYTEFSQFISNFNTNQTDEFIEKMDEFKNKFNKLGIQTKENNSKSSYAELHLPHNNTIYHLINMFGIDAISYMTRYLATSSLDLQRMLTEYAWIERDMNIYFQQFIQKVFRESRTLILTQKKHNDFHIFVRRLFETQELMNRDDFSKLNATLPLEQLTDLLDNILIENMRKYLNITTDEEPTRKQTLSSAAIASLLTANLDRARQEIHVIYKYFLCNDFGLTQQYSSDIINQINQHNKRIRKELNKKGIDVMKAFSYTNESHFTHGGTIANIDYHYMINSLWNNLHQLSLLLNDKDKEHKYIRRKITEFFGNTLNGYNKAPGTLNAHESKIIFTNLKRNKIASITNPSQLDMLIDKLKNAEDLLLKYSKQSSKIKIKSIITQLINDNNALNRTIEYAEEHTQNNTIFKKREFKVVMWNKSSPDTFLIGDNVDCSFSSRNDKFVTMIRRRADDGTFFHVVINKETNKPIAVAWLYFAKCTSNPNDIYIVADYYSINLEFEFCGDLGEIILSHLQDFTFNYAKDIGAKGLLIPTSTSNSYFIIFDFDKTDICLEKVGGFIYNEQINTSFFADYELRSLKQNSFYIYNHLLHERNNQGYTSAPMFTQYNKNQIHSHGNSSIKQVCTII